MEGLIHPGSFQYGAQTEKLQQQLASEKGVHAEVRFHVSLIRDAGPWGLLQSPQKTLSATHPDWLVAQR